MNLNLTPEELRLAETFREVALKHELNLPFAVNETFAERTPEHPYAMEISILKNGDADSAKIWEVTNYWVSQNFTGETLETLYNKGLHLMVYMSVKNQPAAA